MPGTVLSMQNIYLVKKNYANPLEGDTKPPEGDNSMKFVYHQLNSLAKLVKKVQRVASFILRYELTGLITLQLSNVCKQLSKIFSATEKICLL